MHRAALALDLPDPVSAAAVVAALGPEVADGPSGTTTTIRAEAAVIHVEVTGETVSGLRAALNSVVRLLDAARRTV